MDTTSPSLLAAARDGGAEPWRRMVQIYGPMIYSWCRRVGKQPADASDLTQEVLASLSRDLRRFDPGLAGATFRGWLWTITRRRLADQARRDSRRVSVVAEPVDELSLADSVPAEPPTDASIDRAGVLARAVALVRDSFDDSTWQAFLATTVEGRAPAEVADSMGLSRWAIYKARARILQRLRHELDGLL